MRSFITPFVTLTTLLLAILYDTLFLFSFLYVAVRDKTSLQRQVVYGQITSLYRIITLFAPIAEKNAF